MARNACAIWPLDRMPDAHWKSSGWNRWCGRLSTRVTATGAWRSARTANSPAKPPPRITTRRGAMWSSTDGSAAGGEAGEQSHPAVDEQGRADHVVQQV